MALEKRGKLGNFFSCFVATVIFHYYTVSMHDCEITAWLRVFMEMSGTFTVLESSHSADIK